MSKQRYILENDVEIMRLERQAELQGKDRVTDHVTPLPGQKILDAGCGSGWVSRMLAAMEPRAEVQGIDITQAFVAYATQRAQDEGLDNLTYQVGDIRELPFEDATFDLVWSQHVLFFLPDPEKAVAEFARVLRPGGRVAIAITDGVLTRLWPPDPDLSGAIATLYEGVTHGFQAARLPAMVRHAGFGQIDVSLATDRVYTFVGAASPEQRRNVEESYGKGLSAGAQFVGGRDEADRLHDALMKFVDDPATSAVSAHWLVSGVKPG